MLSEDVKKELDKFNQDKKAQYKPNCSRMTEVHEQDHEEVDDNTDRHLIWRTLSGKNPTLCKIQTLRIFWKLIPHTL